MHYIERANTAKLRRRYIRFRGPILTNICYQNICKMFMYYINKLTINLYIVKVLVILVCFKEEICGQPFDAVVLQMHFFHGEVLELTGKRFEFVVVGSK